MKQFGLSGLLVGFLTIFSPFSVRADTISFTDVFTGGDCTPACTPQFQQLYPSSAFTSPGFITSIQFNYLNADLTQTYTFSLSTTPVNALSADFASNIGSNNQLFYTGPLLEPDPMTHNALFVGTPFLYDPSLGNLLLTINHPNSTGFPGTASSYVFWVDRNYSFSAAGSGSGDQGYGLETVFTQLAAVPEPSTWAMFILGFAGVGFMGYRRSRKESGACARAERYRNLRRLNRARRAERGKGPVP